MNFFSAQDQARRNSRRLVFLYAIATLAIVLGVTSVVGAAIFFATATTAGMYTVTELIGAYWHVLAGTALATALFILGASLFKTSVLSSGGAQVAKQMGGTQVPSDVTDPLRRRLRNVVEEMAIASGVPVPDIFVLESEAGINAFAAGYEPDDAAVAVTRGALEILDRDELQGVIAHEFSHILNGDMRLNIRLMGVLFGIMVVGLIGRTVLRGSRYGAFSSSRRGNNASAVFLIGIGLALLGGIGVFFARLIKAGVSRQREFLADASAVQFTRQTDGIANALKKIGGYEHGSDIRAADPEEVSHMLFVIGSKLFGWFATHPPLPERIRALDPSFRDGDYLKATTNAATAGVDDRAAGFAGQTTQTSFTGAEPVTTAAILDAVGNPGIEHIEAASELRRAIPDEIYDAAHSPQTAYLVCLALLLKHDAPTLDRQLALLGEQLGAQRSHLLKNYLDELQGLESQLRLPILEIAFPALKTRPESELSYVLSIAERLIEIDGEVDLYEFCFYRLISNAVHQKARPRASRGELRSATISLLRILADYGHEQLSERESAFAAGIATLGPWARKQEFRSDRTYTIASLNQAFDTLPGLNIKGQESLMRAISATVAHDDQLSLAESELVRALCATLNYPMPPALRPRS